MKSFRTLWNQETVLGLILGLGVGVPSVWADFPPCQSDTPVGSRCECNLADLHPTQIAVGMREVFQKKYEVRRLLGDPKRLEAYKDSHPEPGVFGPGGHFYVIDHHHLALAMLDDGVKTTYCEVRANYSNLSTDDFWHRMSKEHWVWPYDENGKGPLDFSEIPSSVAGLRDDPYRSLAESVLRAGGYNKSEEPFQQFLWANRFRDLISPDQVEHHYDEAVKKGVVLAGHKKQKDLPGYISDSDKDKGKGKKDIPIQLKKIDEDDCPPTGCSSQLFGLFFGNTR